MMIALLSTQIKVIQNMLTHVAPLDFPDALEVVNVHDISSIINHTSFEWSLVNQPIQLSYSLIYSNWEYRIYLVSNEK